MSRPGSASPVPVPHRHRTRLLVAAGLAVVGIASGCGGDRGGGGDGGGGGGANAAAGDFSARAEKVCSEAFKRIGAGAQDGANGLQASRIRGEATAALRRLTPPPERKAQFEKLLDARDDIVAAYVAAEEIEDDLSEEGRAATDRSLATLKRSADAAAKAGLPGCAL